MQLPWQAMNGTLFVPAAIAGSLRSETPSWKAHLWCTTARGGNRARVDSGSETFVSAANAENIGQLGCDKLFNCQLAGRIYINSRETHSVIESRCKEISGGGGFTPGANPTSHSLVEVPILGQRWARPHGCILELFFGIPIVFPYVTPPQCWLSLVPQFDGNFVKKVWCLEPKQALTNPCLLLGRENVKH